MSLHLKDMRFILPLFILTLAHASYGQNIVFKKRTISSTEASVPSTPENRNKFIKGLLSGTNSQSKVVSPNGIIPISINEKFLYSTGTEFFKIRTQPMDQTVTLVKSNSTTEEATLEISGEGKTDVLDDDGHVMFSDFLDGNCAAHLFYSPSLELLNKYTPYDAGAMITSYGYSSKVVCIYSKENYTSQLYKLSLLDHKGNLLLMKDYPSGKYVSSDVQIAGNKIFLVLNDLESPNTKVIALDINLSLLWEKNLDHRLINGKVNKSDDGSSVALITQDKLTVINAHNGSSIWESSVAQIVPQVLGPKRVRVEFILKNQYLALVSSESKENLQVSENILTVVDTKTGQKIFSDMLGVFNNSDAQIINSDNKFLVIANSKINEYTK